MDNKQQLLQKILQNEAWRDLSHATQTKYLFWIEKFCDFLQTKDVSNSSSLQKITEFLINEYQKSSANTKRQAMSALRWMYREIHGIELREFRIKKPYRLPERFVPEFVSDELTRLPVLYQFQGWLFYGSGLSLHEAVNLRHENISHKQINIDTRTIPLCQKAAQLYKALKKSKGRIFPKTNTSFLQQCRRHKVDRRITPSALRANFILLAIQKNGLAWTQHATGLSDMRMQQYKGYHNHSMKQEAKLL
jgi:site-specific recombinase XerD